MTAFYKIDHIKCFTKRKALELEGRERRRARKEVQDGIQDCDWELRKRLIEDEESRLGFDCHQSEFSNPNHQCDCEERLNYFVSGLVSTEKKAA